MWRQSTNFQNRHPDQRRLPFRPPQNCLTTCFKISGLADWTMGYSVKGDDTILLCAIEAQKRSELDTVGKELVPYLAVLRHNRHEAAKAIVQVQGFSSNVQCFQRV